MKGRLSTTLGELRYACGSPGSVKLNGKGGITVEKEPGREISPQLRNEVADQVTQIVKSLSAELAGAANFFDTWLCARLESLIASLYSGVFDPATGQAKALALRITNMIEQIEGHWADGGKFIPETRPWREVLSDQDFVRIENEYMALWNDQRFMAGAELHRAVIQVAKDVCEKPATIMGPAKKPAVALDLSALDAPFDPVATQMAPAKPEPIQRESAPPVQVTPIQSDLFADEVGIEAHKTVQKTYSPGQVVIDPSAF